MLMFNADELFERLGLTVRCEDCEHRNKDCGDVRCENGTWAQVCDVLDHMTLIDAEPVVRCGDCKYLRIEPTAAVCDLLVYDSGYMICHHVKNARDFCSYGERRDDE